MKPNFICLCGAVAALSAFGGLTDDECDRFFRLSPAEKAARFAKMNESDIWSYRCNALRRLADISLEPPAVITDTLPKYDYDKNNYAMNAGIAKTRGGRIWMMWIAGEDGPRATVVGAWSDDGGRTFTKPKFAVDGNFPDRRLLYLKDFHRTSVVGNLWAAPDGSLHLFVDQSICGNDGRRSVWQFICENPDDPNPKWGPAQFLWYGLLTNKPVPLKDGKWLIQGHHEGMAFAFPELAKERTCWFMVSSDLGRTWRWQGRIDTKDKDLSPCEPMTIVQDDGTLRCLIRTAKGIYSADGNGLMQSFSKDEGRTWTEPAFVPNIRHPAARFFFSRLRNGHVLLVKHGLAADRMPTESEACRKATGWVRDFLRRCEICAFVSRDGGKTWEGGLLLDDRQAISYPDGFQDEDGSIYVSYDWERSAEGQICLAHFTEDDILAGRLVSQGSFLKHTAIRPVKSRRQAEAGK